MVSCARPAAASGGSSEIKRAAVYPLQQPVVRLFKRSALPGRRSAWDCEVTLHRKLLSCSRSASGDVMIVFLARPRLCRYKMFIVRGFGWKDHGASDAEILLAPR